MGFTIQGDTFKVKDGPRNKMPRQASGNERFTYFHVRHGWSFDPKLKEWLPELRQIAHMRGCNGVTPQGSAKTTIATLMERGHNVLILGAKKLGPYKHYLKTWPTISSTGVKGKAYTSIFERPVVHGPDAKDVTWQRDDKGYTKFQRYLTKHVVEPMTRDVLQAKLAAKEDRAVRMSKGAENPVIKAKFEAVLAEIEDMQEAWDKQFSRFAEDEAFASFADIEGDLVDPDEEEGE